MAVRSEFLFADRPNMRCAAGSFGSRTAGRFVVAFVQTQVLGRLLALLRTLDHNVIEGCCRNSTLGMLTPLMAMAKRPSVPAQCASGIGFDLG